MEDVEPEHGEKRRLYRGIATCAVLQIMVSAAIAFVDPGAPASLIDDYGLIFIIFVLPAAIASAPIRWLVERRGGEGAFVGAWAAVVRAKILFHLALLVALPTLGIATAFVWLMGWPTGELGRAWLLLLVAGGLLSVVGTLLINLLNLFAPRGRGV